MNGIIEEEEMEDEGSDEEEDEAQWALFKFIIKLELWNIHYTRINHKS